jgi:predicted protein tyrosine phosphatase
MFKNLEILKFVSQPIAEYLIPVDNWAMISIRCPGDTVKLQEGWKNLLVLEFDDVDFQFDNYVVFSDEQAGEVIEFLDNLDKDIKGIIVHCLAGISRSSAVALFIRDYYAPKHLPSLSYAECYNRHVRSMLEKRYHDV